MLKALVISALTLGLFTTYALAAPMLSPEDIANRCRLYGMLAYDAAKSRDLKIETSDTLLPWLVKQTSRKKYMNYGGISS